MMERVVLFDKGTDSIPGGPTLMASSAPKDASFYYITLGIRVSTFEFWGDTSIQIIADKEILEEKI